jgi:ABC-type polysaccharide/polyol phosphate export permease
VRPYAAFNPMTGPVLAFKWGILGTAAFPAWELAVSGALTAVTLVAGVWYFTRAENAAADSL